MSWPPLDDEQLIVLHWIEDGCPEGPMHTRTNQICALTLQGRNLVSISQSEGPWRATLTEEGRFYLNNGHYKPAPRCPIPHQTHKDQGETERVRRALPPQDLLQMSAHEAPAPQPSEPGRPSAHVQPIWLDAFPWLRAVAPRRADEWWNCPISPHGDPSRHTRLAEIAALAVERLQHWALGQILPWLPLSLDLGTLPFRNRAKHVLIRQSCQVCGDLAPLSLGEILEWRNIGLGTLDDMLRVLANHSTTKPANSDLERHEAAQKFDPSGLVETHLTLDLSSLFDEVPDPSVAAFSDADLEPTPLEEETDAPPEIDDQLRILARWFVSMGLVDVPVLTTPVPHWAPDEVLEARSRLNEHTPQQLDQNSTSVAARLDCIIQEQPKRIVSILESRLFADAPETLDLLGSMHGVSRERIRQLEGQARANLLDALTSSETIRWANEAARRLSSPVRPLYDLLQAVPALAEVVPTVAQPVWRVLDRLDDAYEIVDGWCAAPSVSAAKDYTQLQLDDLSDQYGVAKFEDLDIVRSTLQQDQSSQTEEWLRYCGYTILGSHVLANTSSIGNYAAAVLSIQGSPLSLSDISKQFLVERSLGSIRNAVANDSRFERVDVDLWGLSSWGLGSYSGIRGVIREALEKAGGCMKLEELVDQITERYSVATSSVTSYAASPPFSTIDGFVQVGGQNQRTHRRPERTRRLFRHPNSWALRITVSPDQMRGSGTSAPTALASILGLNHGETIQLPSRLGPQGVGWNGPQPYYSTIRRFLLDLDLEIGSDAFLIFHDDGSFSFAPMLPLSDAEPVTQVLRLLGRVDDTALNDPRAAIASSLGLAPDVSVPDLINAFKERGDEDVAEALADCRSALGEPSGPVATRSAGVDDILALL